MLRTTVVGPTERCDCLVTYRFFTFCAEHFSTLPGVRGLFKEYTPDKPLFGKIAGLFWWEPHLAGAAVAE